MGLGILPFPGVRALPRILSTLTAKPLNPEPIWFEDVEPLEPHGNSGQGSSPPTPQLFERRFRVKI